MLSETERKIYDDMRTTNAEYRVEDIAPFIWGDGPWPKWWEQEVRKRMRLLVKRTHEMHGLRPVERISRLGRSNIAVYRVKPGYMTQLLEELANDDG